MKKYLIPGVITALMASTASATLILNQTVYSQDFTSSSTLTDYVGTGAGQLNYIEASGQWSVGIDGNRLEYSRSGTAETSVATMGKTTAIDVNTSPLVQFAWNMTMDNFAGDNTTAFARFGVSGTETNTRWQESPTLKTDVLQDAFGDFQIRLAGSGWAVRQGSTDSDFMDFGTYATVRLIAYHGDGALGESVDYLNPAGGVSSLDKGHYAIWVDNSLLATLAANTASSMTPTKFKMTTVGDITSADMLIDNMTVSVIPEPGTITLLLLGGVAMLLSRSFKK